MRGGGGEGGGVVGHPLFTLWLKPCVYCTLLYLHVYVYSVHAYNNSIIFCRLVATSLGMRLELRPVLRQESSPRVRRRSLLWRGPPPWHRLPRSVTCRSQVSDVTKYSLATLYMYSILVGCIGLQEYYYIMLLMLSILNFASVQIFTPHSCARDKMVYLVYHPALPAWKWPDLDI